MRIYADPGRIRENAVRQPADRQPIIVLDPRQPGGASRHVRCVRLLDAAGKVAARVTSEDDLRAWLETDNRVEEV